MEATQQIIRHNKRYYILTATLYTFATSFLGSGFSTPFSVNELKMTTFEMSLSGTIGSIAGMLTYFLLSVCHIRNMKRLLIVTSFLLCLSPLTSIFNLFVGRTPILIPLLCTVGAINAVAGACKNTCEYSITPMLFPRKEYGEMSAKCGIIGGLAAIGISIISVFFENLSLFNRYLLFFAIGAVAYFLSAMLILQYRLISNLEPQKTENESIPAPKEKKTFSGKLTEKIWMLFPHLLRGIVNVGFAYIMIIALRNFTFSATGQSMLITISSAALLIACYAFMKIEKRVRSGVIILISYVIYAICALFACMTKSEVVFLVLYCIYLMASNIKDYAIPVGVMYSTRTEDLPYISSVRMLAVRVSSLVLTTPVAALIDTINPLIVVFITCILAFFTGVIFCIQYKDKYKKAA